MRPDPVETMAALPTGAWISASTPPPMPNRVIPDLRIRTTISSPYWATSASAIQSRAVASP